MFTLTATKQGIMGIQADTLTATDLEDLASKVIEGDYSRSANTHADGHWSFFYWADPDAFEDDEAPEKPNYTIETVTDLARSVFDTSNIVIEEV
ncbi:hypothetical protein HMPREF1219_00183 [Corynebacterium pyruviciproducens ATCC BAA-1742]|uniref:Uncharacterized protein n=1 Tax=Corynebacterium pyruviciproducens ATCC BAA-1742 TaxID=1125779 RepID=S2Z2A9_9CORY|nr:hypothetical protein [Corynebacterium pyruviciproducens]EPD70888.1 hypothetical protein HMPREF1219_00183 [Corynebacterium pyruviciproducens ATCC BAA-1742]